MKRVKFKGHTRWIHNIDVNGVDMTEITVIKDGTHWFEIRVPSELFKEWGMHTFPNYDASIVFTEQKPTPPKACFSKRRGIKSWLRYFFLRLQL